MRALMLAALLGVGLGVALAAPATEVSAVLAVPRERIEQADYRASGQLVRVDANGARTSYAVTLKAHWFPGVLRVLMEITSPAQARAHILFEMRPDGRNAIEIARPGDRAPVPLPFDKWSDGPLGPGFSYEDFLESQYFWPGQAELAPAKYGARDCYVIKSTPGAQERTHYAQVKTWLDKGIGFPVYVEKSLKGSGAVKEFTYFGLRHTGGVWSASQVEVKIHGQAGSTLLIVERGSAQASLTLKDFSPAQLIHFQDVK